MAQVFRDKLFWLSLLLALGLHCYLLSEPGQTAAPAHKALNPTPIQLQFEQAPAAAKPVVAAASAPQVSRQRPPQPAKAEAPETDVESSYFRPHRLDQPDLASEAAELTSASTKAPDGADASHPASNPDLSNSPVSPPEPEPSATTPLAEAIPRYQVKSPPSGSMQMQIKREEPGKNPVYGKAEFSYQLSPAGGYKLSLQASLSILFASINLYQMESKGQLAADGAGLQAEINSERRRNRSEIAVHFNRQEHQVSFSAANKTQSVSPYVQDKASFLMQLSGIALADPSTIAVGKSFLFQIAEEKNVSEFVFHVLAEEEIDTPLGKLLTWHLQRPAKPGSYSSVLDVWLAPAYQWYPVQIRNTESNGAITTQTANQIQLEHVTSSSPP